MPLLLQSACLSDVGLYRVRNEDSVFEDASCGFYVLADGMGGHASGDVAAKMTTELSHKLIKECLVTYVPSETLLQEVIGQVNARIYTEANSIASYRGMGSTIVALLRDANDLLVAHVGDSRCYRLREGTFSQLTEDHSLRNYYIREYGYTAEQAAEAAESNVIIRAMGLHDSTLVDVGRHALQAGDLYLVCSDGLSDYVEEEDIISLISQEMSLTEMSKALIALANLAGGYDNTSVVLLRVVEGQE